MTTPSSSPLDASLSLSPRRTFLIPCHWQAGAQMVGCPIEELLAAAGLPEVWAERQHLYLTASQCCRLWEVFADRIGPWELVRKTVAAMEYQLKTPYLAGLSSRDLQSGLERFSQCKQLCCPMRCDLEPHPGGATLSITNVSALPSSLLVGELAAILAMARKGTGHAVVPLLVECPDASEVPAKLVNELFGVALRSGPATRIGFRTADLQRPMRSFNPFTLQMVDQFYERDLAEAASTLLQDVTDALQRLLPDGRSKISDVAHALGMSTRSLQRDLQSAGINFRDVLAATRERLAKHYLGTTGHSPVEVAILLGYSEVATFSRAFRQWTGTSPAAFATQAGSQLRVAAG